MSSSACNVEILLNRCDVLIGNHMEGEVERVTAGKNAEGKQEGVEWKADNPRRKKMENCTKKVLNDPINNKIPS